MNRLEIQFEVSEESNDHQARIHIDGEDYLKNDYLGLDPPEFFAQAALLEGGRAHLGRCGCGVVGCDNIDVEVEAKENTISWLVNQKHLLEFRKEEYNRAILEASKDFSWESKDRTAERKVNAIFANSKLKSGHKYQWASARIEVGTVKLSFMNQSDQLLHSIKWDCTDPESASDSAEEAYKRLIPSI